MVLAFQMRSAIRGIIRAATMAALRACRSRVPMVPIVSGQKVISLSSRVGEGGSGEGASCHLDPDRDREY